MTDKPDRDGILDPRASEPVALPPEIEAFDRWAAEPDNLAAWEAARRWLAHAAGDVDDVMDVARTALLLAPDGPERERARRDDLLADQRPLRRLAGTGAGAARAPRPAGRPRRGRRDGQGVLRPVRRAAGARDGGQLRGSRRSLGLASA